MWGPWDRRRMGPSPGTAPHPRPRPSLFCLSWRMWVRGSARQGVGRAKFWADFGLDLWMWFGSIRVFFVLARVWRVTPAGWRAHRRAAGDLAAGDGPGSVWFWRVLWESDILLGLLAPPVFCPVRPADARGTRWTGLRKGSEICQIRNFASFHIMEAGWSRAREPVDANDTSQGKRTV